MYPNLDAEQGRRRSTNQQVANYLRISRVPYENKKKTGKFTAPQLARLCQRYDVAFEYLYADTQDSAKNRPAVDPGGRGVHVLRRKPKAYTGRDLDPLIVAFIVAVMLVCMYIQYLIFFVI